jgi:hypothetical protein
LLDNAVDEVIEQIHYFFYIVEQIHY